MGPLVMHLLLVKSCYAAVLDIKFYANVVNGVNQVISQREHHGTLHASKHYVNLIISLSLKIISCQCSPFQVVTGKIYNLQHH